MRVDGRLHAPACPSPQSANVTVLLGLHRIRAIKTAVRSVSYPADVRQPKRSFILIFLGTHLSSGSSRHIAVVQIGGTFPPQAALTWCDWDLSVTAGEISFVALRTSSGHTISGDKHATVYATIDFALRRHNSDRRMAFLRSSSQRSDAIADAGSLRTDTKEHSRPKARCGGGCLGRGCQREERFASSRS
jgi:hypothetical protein